MYCIKCGKQLNEGAKFCSRCGVSVFRTEINKVEKKETATISSTNPKPKIKRKKSTVKWIMVFITILIFMGIGLGIFKLYSIEAIIIPSINKIDLEKRDDTAEEIDITQKDNQEDIMRKDHITEDIEYFDESKYQCLLYSVDYSEGDEPIIGFNLPDDIPFWADFPASIEYNGEKYCYEYSCEYPSDAGDTLDGHSTYLNISSVEYSVVDGKLICNNSDFPFDIVIFAEEKGELETHFGTAKLYFTYCEDTDRYAPHDVALLPVGSSTIKFSLTDYRYSDYSGELETLIPKLLEPNTENSNGIEGKSYIREFDVPKCMIDIDDTYEYIFYDVNTRVPVFGFNGISWFDEYGTYEWTLNYDSCIEDSSGRKLNYFAGYGLRILVPLGEGFYNYMPDRIVIKTASRDINTIFDENSYGYKNVEEIDSVDTPYGTVPIYFAEWVSQGDCEAEIVVINNQDTYIAIEYWDFTNTYDGVYEARLKDILVNSFLW